VSGWPRQGGLLIDHSAWIPLSDPALPDARAIELGDELEAGGLAVCLPFFLEAGYSARRAREYAELREELLVLPRVILDEASERRALDAQQQLLRVGHHRMPPVDLLIAALADRHELGVLHYDSDFDLILEKTDLEFHSEWLMPRGSL
jgi:predicted nucleic acid-binding protein